MVVRQPKPSESCAFFLCLSLLFMVTPTYGEPTLAGDTVSASLLSLNSGSCAIITQFVSPQVVTDSGAEFTRGQFTPNAALWPLPIQFGNSIAAEIDVFTSMCFRLVFSVSGGIAGFQSYCGPVLRVNLSGLNPSDGSCISGLDQTDGPTNPPPSVIITSPSSVSLDFSSFGSPPYGLLPDTYYFKLQTTQIPEPSTFVLVCFGMIALRKFALRRL
jgi:hypothetical protein